MTIYDKTWLLVLQSKAIIEIFSSYNSI